MDSNGTRCAVANLVPRRPPLELIKRDGVWAVREYYDLGEQPEQGVTRFSTHAKRTDAMRVGQERMEERQHPFLLRWESQNNVGGMYWNQEFETLSVRFSELLSSWTVKAEPDGIVLSVNSSDSEALSTGKQMLEEYNFKRVVCYSTSGDKRVAHKHRFVRNEIADYGVRFNREQIPKSAETPAESSDTDTNQPATSGDVAITEDDGGDDDEQTRDVTGVHSSFVATVPDLTELREIDTDGVAHVYAVPWDDTTARALILSPEYADEQQAVNTFATVVSDWLALATHDNVVKVFESDADPGTWIIYDGDYPRLSTVVDDLSVVEQMSVLLQLGDIATVAQREGIHSTGLTPRRVCVTKDSSSRAKMSSNDTALEVKLTGLGLRDRVSRAVGDSDPTRFTPPELLNGGTVQPTTPVYRLGAIAYYFLTGSPPYYACSPTAGSLSEASITPPNAITDIPIRVSQCIMQALHENPRQRYETGKTFVRELINLVEQ